MDDKSEDMGDVPSGNAEGEGPGPVLGAFLQAIQAPSLILDTKELVTDANAAAKKELPNVKIGMPVSFVLRQPDFLKAMEEVLDKGQPRSVDILQTTPNMTWFSIVVSLLKVPHDNRVLEYLLVTLENRTEQRRAETMRVDFVANVSHELRTPLTSLIGFVDTLLGAAATDEEAHARFLPLMRNQAERMSKLIDDLLSLSRLELRQHLRPTDEVDIAGIVLYVVEELQPQIKRAGVKINLKLCDKAMVAGDHDELCEIVENLLDNAIKYGGEGKRIDIELRPVVTRTDYAYVFSVTDFGAGIEESHVPRLTERFYRVGTLNNRQKKGTGLGLAIVKHIVSRHHGQLNISSTPGKGTRVEILLPD